MSPDWEPAGALSEDGPRSPYALWRLARPDRAERIEAVALAVAPEDAARAAFDRDPESDALRERGGGAGARGAAALEGLTPDVLPEEALRPDLRARPGPAPDPPTRRPLARAPLDADGPVALIGVIDDAIPFAHERLRDRDGATRVEYLWLQGARHDGRAATPFGREYAREAIDGLLDAHRRGGGIDEESLYRATGLLDLGCDAVQSAAFAATHGAAVADLAAGFDERDQSRPAAARPAGFDEALGRQHLDERAMRVAAICLPPAVVRETSGAFAAPFVLAGVERILAQADALEAALGRRVDVVVNISFGVTAGSKDGLGRIESALDAAADGRRVRFVLPSGNHRLSRTAARMPAPAPDAPLYWRLPPDDATPSFLEVWGPRRAEGRPPAPRFALGLQPPGAAAPVLPPEDRLAFDRVLDLRDAGRLLARLWIQWRPEDPAAPAGPGREFLALAVPPTCPTEPGAAWAPPGDWRLTAARSAAAEGATLPLELYVQRDDTVAGYRRGGRQSRLHDPEWRERTPGGLALEAPAGRYVDAEMTLNAFATGHAPLVVGGCYAENGGSVAYSSRGAAAAGRRKPDLLAPAERSPLLGGVLAAGARSGAGSILGGASLAAPLAARELAKVSIRGGADERDPLSGVAVAPPPPGERAPRLRARPEAPGPWETACGGAAD